MPFLACINQTPPAFINIQQLSGIQLKEGEEKIEVVLLVTRPELDQTFTFDSQDLAGAQLLIDQIADYMLKPKKQPMFTVL